MCAPYARASLSGEAGRMIHRMRAPQARASSSAVAARTGEAAVPPGNRLVNVIPHSVGGLLDRPAAGILAPQEFCRRVWYLPLFVPRFSRPGTHFGVTGILFAPDICPFLRHVFRASGHAPESDARLESVLNQTHVRLESVRSRPAGRARQSRTRAWNLSESRTDTPRPETKVATKCGISRSFFFDPDPPPLL